MIRLKKVGVFDSLIKFKASSESQIIINIVVHSIRIRRVVVEKFYSDNVGRNDLSPVKRSNIFHANTSAWFLN